MTSAVSVNSLVPSGSTVGASGVLPTPSVFAPSVSCATYASTGSFIDRVGRVVLLEQPVGVHDMAGVGVAADHQIADHPGFLVPGDVAEHRVGAGLEAREVERIGFARGEIGGLQVGAVDREVVLDGAAVRHGEAFRRAAPTRSRATTRTRPTSRSRNRTRRHPNHQHRRPSPRTRARRERPRVRSRPARPRTGRRGRDRDPERPLVRGRRRRRESDSARCRTSPTRCSVGPTPTRSSTCVARAARELVDADLAHDRTAESGPHRDDDSGCERRPRRSRARPGLRT